MATVEVKPETKTNLGDVIREYFPGASREQVEGVLWSCTGFPGAFSPKDGQTNLEVFREQLAEARDNSGGDPDLAVSMANWDLDRAMAHGRDVEEVAARKPLKYVF